MKSLSTNLALANGQQVVGSKSKTRRIATALGVITCIALFYYIAAFGIEALCKNILALRQSTGWWSLVGLMLVYAVLLAIPFVPGIELGLLLIVLFGPWGALAAHAATVVGLTLAFAIGKGMTTRGDKVHLDWPQWFERLIGSGLLSRLAQNRYLALAVMLNMPGNAIVGGGGGLAVASGVSGLFSWTGFVMTVTVATAPIPLLVWAGQIDLASILIGSPSR